VAIQEQIEQAQGFLAAKATQASGVVAGSFVSVSGEYLALSVQILTAISLLVLISSGSIDLYRKIKNKSPSEKTPKKPNK